MKVKLLTKTDRMFSTIWNVWHSSQSNEPLVQKDLLCTERLEEMKDLFFRILEENIPITDMVEFIFLLEDIPISLREQIVRHRLGIKFDDRIGIDHVPELIDSTFWCQSMRVLDMSEFDYYVPESIKHASSSNPYDRYCCVMDQIRQCYKKLLEMGIPKEDARQIIPLGATHRMVWKLSLSAVRHICKKRSCWIAQLGMWKPIIQGMISELTKFDKRFYQLICPPCICQEKFQGCKFTKHNEKRITGEGSEEMPPCPLYLHYHENSAVELYIAGETVWEYNEKWFSKNQRAQEHMKQMTADYQKLWNRNPHTGETLNGS